MAVAWFAHVAPPDQRDMLRAHDRGCTGQSRERRITLPDGERETHACHRPCLRLLRCREVGVGVHVGESDVPTVSSGTKQAAQHDAAIASQHEDESTVVETDGDAIRERPTVGRYAAFVACASGRTDEILIGRGHDVTEIRGAEPFHKPQFTKDRGRPIHMLRLTALVVRAQADTRWRSDDRDWTTHDPHTIGRRVVGTASPGDLLSSAGSVKRAPRSGRGAAW